MSERFDPTERAEPESNELDVAGRAEEMRLAGDAGEAARIAVLGLERWPESDPCRVALGLALLDQGEIEQARLELSRILASALADSRAPVGRPAVSHDFDEAVGDDELDRAFAGAESDPDEMFDANRVVERTLEGEVARGQPDFDPSEHPAYATETMASLLESQGRAAEAGAIRASMQHAEPPPVEAASGLELDEWPARARETAHHDRVVETLEGWLHNIRARSIGQQAGASTGASR